MAYPHKWLPISYRSSADREVRRPKDRRYTTVQGNQPLIYLKRPEDTIGYDTKDTTVLLKS